MVSGGICDLVIGTDLVCVDRLRHAFARHGERFLLKMLSPDELARCRIRAEICLKRAAGRIAVKESVAKALGVGLNGLGWSQGIAWHDVSVISIPNQPPELALSGHALALSRVRGISRWRVTLSHDGAYATATVLGLIPDTGPPA